MRLRYTGQVPVTFVSLGVEVDPGGEFDAPDDAAGGLLARPDVEAVAPEAKAVRRKAKTPADSAGDDPAPVVTEES